LEELFVNRQIPGVFDLSRILPHMPQRFWWDFFATRKSIYQVLIPRVAELNDDVVYDSGKAWIADKLYTEVASLDARLVVA
jgi:hypothetical protein